MRAGFVLVAVCVALVPTNAEPPKKPDAAKIRDRLKGPWLEYNPNMPTEKQLTVNGGIEWNLYTPYAENLPANASYMIDHENESVGVYGEVLLNADVEPMWLDFKFKDAGREVIDLGIIRFEGDNLMWVRAARVDATKWVTNKGVFKDRATTFQNDKKELLGYRLERPKKRK